jgi:hypothetical protein
MRLGIRLADDPRRPGRDRRADRRRSRGSPAVNAKEFGQPVWLVRLEGWLRRLIRRPRNVTHYVGRVADSAAVTDSIQVKVTRAPGVVLEGAAA